MFHVVTTRQKLALAVLRVMEKDGAMVTVHGLMIDVLKVKPGDLIRKKNTYYTFELTVLMHLKLGKL